MDIVLSSGFLAFARHIGFRRVCVEKDVSVTGICGTSSGSVVGALWANGVSERDMIDLLNVPRPLDVVDLHWQPWRGLFQFHTFKEKLRAVLPEKIEDLPIPFGVGLCTMDRNAIVVTKGNLVDAIAASCAVPYMFCPMQFEGTFYRDGGFADRIGMQSWKQLRQNEVHEFCAHIVDRSNGVANEKGLDGVKVIRTPRSFASLFSMGDFDGQLIQAAEMTRQQW
jgi:NTE family protein